MILPFLPFLVPEPALAAGFSVQGVDPWLIRESNVPIELNKEIIRSLHGDTGSLLAAISVYAIGL